MNNIYTFNKQYHESFPNAVLVYLICLISIKKITFQINSLGPLQVWKISPVFKGENS